MRIRLYINRSIHENAAYYYEEAKQARKKTEGLEQAIEETKKQIKEAKNKKKKKQIKIKRKKEWYEKFNWFFTSNEKLAIGGRNAQQNDQVFAKHMDDDDLFFHADIQGGSAMILKDGVNANEQELIETAQFAGCFSNAWKNGNAAVDVYSVKKDQLSKHATGGFIPTGAFGITGKRTWFKNTKIGIRIGKKDKTIISIPKISKTKLEDEIVLLPSKSGKDKGELAKIIAKRFNVHPDDLLEILPNGKSKISEERKK